MSRLGSTAARLKLKGIDGEPHKRWTTWLNSTINEEPYQGLTCQRHPGKPGFHKDAGTGAAWLSSACAVRFSLKWGNMRNPHPVLYVSQETAPPLTFDSMPKASKIQASLSKASGGEEGEDDAKSAWPFDVLGCTRGTMAGTAGCQAVRRS